MPCEMRLGRSGFVRTAVWGIYCLEHCNYKWPPRFLHSMPLDVLVTLFIERERIVRNGVTRQIDGPDREINQAQS